MQFRILLFLVLALVPHVALAQDPLVLTTDDEVAVYGDHYHAKGTSSATILVFHQAESNRAEYALIIPRLVNAGFDVIAIDQRSGGDRFGQENHTVNRLEGSTDFLNALPDLEAALSYARFVQPTNPVILWGSSYSASLVFLLAAQHSDAVAAILAFSPGEYFPDKSLVAAAASKVTVPIFVTSSPDAAEVEQARAILAASPAKVKVQYVPKTGRHGSSTLHPDADPAGAEETWSAVNKFLGKVIKPGAG